MTGYIFIAAILLFIGAYTGSINLYGGFGNFEYVIGSVGFIYIIIVPILTMRVLAEEKRQKTDQLLLTAPVSVAGIVVGKYLAMIAVLLFPTLVISLYPLILSMYGSVPFLVIYCSIFGFFLMGSALIAIGMFISSLVENQLIAATLSFVVMLFAYMLSGITKIVSSSALGSLIVFTVFVFFLAIFINYMTQKFTVALAFGVIAEIILCLFYRVNPAAFDGSLIAILNKLAIYDYLFNFVYKGLFELTAIVFYLTVIFLFLFFCIQVIEMRRWK
jgi:ABC-2 type transport system permease protein